MVKELKELIHAKAIGSIFHAYDVECPVCQTGPGAPCYGDGKMPIPHPMRVIVAENAVLNAAVQELTRLGGLVNRWQSTVDQFFREGGPMLHYRCERAASHNHVVTGKQCVVCETENLLGRVTKG